MASFNFGSTSGSRPYGTLNIDIGKSDPATNSTSITYSLVLHRPSQISSSATKYWSCVINGVTHSGSGKIGGSGNLTLLTGSQTITHNNDGTKAFNYSASIGLEITWSGTPLGTISGSSTVTLPTIPRASAVSVNVGSAYPNNGITVNVNRASSSFTHTINYSCNGASGTIGTSVTTSVGWTIPTSFITNSPNANQTCTITCYTYSGGSHIGTTSTTFTVLCYSPSTVSSTSGNILGNAFALNVNRQSSLLTHSIWYSFGSLTWQSIGSNVATSTSFVPALSLCNQIPNSASGSMTIILRTYYSGTQIGADQYSYYTIYAPDSIVPSFSGITCNEAVQSVLNSVGVFVQNKTKLNLSVTGAVGIYGSTVKSYKITVAGQTINTQTGTTNIITGSGVQTITAVITDSRGRSATKTMNITVLEYTNPKLSKAEVKRNADTSAIVTANLEAKSLLVSTIEKNKLLYKIEYKAISDYSYKAIEGEIKNVSSVLNKTVLQLDAGKSYEFRLYVGDVFGYTSTYEIIKISTAFKSFDFDVKNGRIGIEKVLEHEDSIIEVPKNSKIYVGEIGINLEDILVFVEEK